MEDYYMIKCSYNCCLEDVVQVAKPCSKKIRSIIGYFMEKASEFSVLDFAAFKMCLISFGILLGAKFSKFFKKYSLFIGIALVMSYVYLIYRLFFAEE